MTENNQKHRIRYSDVNMGSLTCFTKKPKNTLITVQEKDVIYFGIARCHSIKDRFKKAEGKRLALDRVEFAKNDHDKNRELSVSFYLDSSGLLGYCRIPYVKLLLKYFESIDEICKRKNK
ncbi:hypothetical protein HYV49_01150 [Candidatus Pacearchaeota archaeon]|nr:hypothetical protein [Candidatus Pacearchaeota archaeon]